MVDLHHHGDAEVAFGMVDFAVNVLVPEPPHWLQATLADELVLLASYPDCLDARDDVARHHGVPADHVLLTNGAAEAFTLLARAREWRHPVVVHPQFTEPEAALRVAGHDVDRVILDAATGFALHADLVPDEADLVVVGNPTNPTGVLHARETLLALRRPGRVLVVDEAFLDVVDEAATLAGEDDVVVLRSLTKAFGIAGLRAGYLVGPPEVVAAAAGTQPPWSVGSLAARAVTSCLGPDGREHLDELVELLPARRRHLVDTLAGHGFAVVDGRAPFVLAQHPAATFIRKELARNGIAVRRGDSFPGLDGTWLRFAVRDRPTTDLLARALGPFTPSTGAPPS